ncbi:hypothetical protein B0A49_00850 [Cryomyces minteri]|uniref:DASH complex subunit DUO1 n=1 Tax=Cryomyces minteri TaxID=331657 RepID=A0A4U0XVH7_9PEZI|nr:hypothetical protein B0A49_00850 [Cryomyces minteri]
MAPPKIPDLEGFSISDSDPEDLFASPQSAKQKAEASSGSSKTPQPTSKPQSKYTAEEAREAALRKELDSIRSVNKVIQDVNASLEKAKRNMGTVHTTLQSATTLLETWTRVLSQTEHNQRLLLNPSWHGASQDLEDAETEALQRQQLAERREAEERVRREVAQRKAEEDEERRRTAGSTPASSRGRGRGRGGRPASASAGSGTAYVGVGGQRGVGRGAVPGRAGSGIGRGVGRTGGAEGEG